MNSFHFFKKYYEGEYEKYSPFLSLIIDKLLENRFTIVYVNQFTFKLITLKGDKEVYLVFEKDEAVENENYIKLNGLQVIFVLKNEKIVVDHIHSYESIQKKVNYFFKKIKDKKEDDLSSILKKEFRAYLKSINDNSLFKNLKSLDKYFNNSIQKEHRQQLFLKWIFSHKVLKEVLSLKKSYLNLLETNPIVCVFDKALQLLEKEIDVVSEETLSILKAKMTLIDFDQFINYISEELKSATEWNHKIDTLSKEDTYLSRFYFSVEILNTIFKKKNIGLSASIGLDLIEYILETDKINTKYDILCECIEDYYVSLCLLDWHKLNSNINYFFLDLSTMIQLEESFQKDIFQEKESKKPFDSLNNIEILIFDFGRYVDNIAFNENIKLSIKNGKKLDASLNIITSILKNVPQSSKCLALFNNHLLYNSLFKNLRSWISKNYSTTLKELILNQPLSPIVLNLDYEKNRKGIKHILLNKVGNQSKKGVNIAENGDWFQLIKKDTLPLFSRNNGIFGRSYRALFSKENRMPLESYQNDGNSTCVLKKPFSKQIFVSKNKLYATIEGYDNQFYNNNFFLCLGYENTNKKRIIVPTSYYPTYHFLEKLQCFPLLNKNSGGINITDYAYIFFRQKLIVSLEERHLNNIEEKDKQLKVQILKLKKLTLSLPVLNKFSQRIEELYESNTRENVSKVNIKYYHISDSLKGKVSILKRGAKERKRLLNTIEKEITIFDSLLKMFNNIETTYYKEFGLLTKENIFYYTLAVTNSKKYYKEFGYYFLYDEPMIPFLPNMWEWIFYGKRLLNSFNGDIENNLKFKIKRLAVSNLEQELEQIKIIKKTGSILINHEIEIIDLPPMVWEYKVNGKCPVEWKVIEIRKRFKGTKLNEYLVDKIVDEIIRSCNIALQITQTLNQINQLDFKLTH